MEYLISGKRSPEDESPIVYRHVTDIDRVLEVMDRPEEDIQSKELLPVDIIPCLNMEEGIGVLRFRHDQGLLSPLTYVIGDSRWHTAKVVQGSPCISRETSIPELVTLTREHGRVLVPHHYGLRKFESGFESELDEAGLVDIEGNDGVFFEFNPAKRKARKNQGKYYRRGRMRRGDVPQFVVRDLITHIEGFFYKNGIPLHVSGTGSTEGCMSIFESLYKGMKNLDLLQLMRKSPSTNHITNKPRWYEVIDEASNYVVGCKEHHTFEDFANDIEAECDALGIIVPAYMKGQKHGTE